MHLLKIKNVFLQFIQCKTLALVGKYTLIVIINVTYFFYFICWYMNTHALPDVINVEIKNVEFVLFLLSYFYW